MGIFETNARGGKKRLKNESSCSAFFSLLMFLHAKFGLSGINCSRTLYIYICQSGVVKIQSRDKIKEKFRCNISPSFFYFAFIQHSVLWGRVLFGQLLIGLKLKTLSLLTLQLRCFAFLFFYFVDACIKHSLNDRWWRFSAVGWRQFHINVSTLKLWCMLLETYVDRSILPQRLSSVPNKSQLKKVDRTTFFKIWEGFRLGPNRS